MKKTISKAKALLLRIDQLGVLKKTPSKSDIKRANKKLKDVADITGVSIQVQEDSSTKGP
jgi:hypothetical protein